MPATVGKIVRRNPDYTGVGSWQLWPESEPESEESEPESEESEPESEESEPESLSAGQAAPESESDSESESDAHTGVAIRQT